MPVPERIHETSMEEPTRCPEGGRLERGRRNEGGDESSSVENVGELGVHPAHRLVGRRGPGRDAEPDRFVGRRHPLRQVQALLSGCLEDGRGTAICLRGPAGIGKTRLLTEVKARALLGGFEWIEAVSVGFGAGGQGGALRALVAGLLGANESDGEWARLALERAIDQGLVSREHGPCLLELLDVPLLDSERRWLAALDGRARAEQRWEAFSELVKATCREKPLILALEDLHSADSVTLNFATRLITLANDVRCLFFFTTRSEDDPLSELARDFEPSDLVRIELGPLRREEAQELIAGLGVTEASLAERYVEQAAGHPLFLEVLVEAGPSELRPASFEALVLSSVERLSPAEKEAIELLSVLGQRAPLGVLRALLGAPNFEPLPLVERNLFSFDQDALCFRHALVREAIYEALERTRREKLHALAAAYYEQRDPLLHAEHLELSGRPAALAYLRAATELFERRELERAARLLDHALGITHRPNELYALAMLRGQVALDAAEPDEAIDAYESALGDAESDRERSAALIGLALALRRANRYGEMLTVVGRAWGLAEEFDWPLERAKLHYLRGCASSALGYPGDALLEHEAALKCVERAGNIEWKVRILSGIAEAHYALCQMTLAEMHFEEAAKLGNAHGLFRLALPNQLISLMIHLLRGKTALVLEVVGRVLAERERAVERNTIVAARQVSAMAHLLRGEFELARREASASLEVARRLERRDFDAESLALQAIAELALGRRESAWGLARAAVSSARSAGIALSGAVALGAYALLCDDAEEAEKALEEGEALVRARPRAHDRFWFSVLALRYGVVARRVALVEEHASLLVELARRDHLVTCELAAELARAHVRGNIPASLFSRAGELGLSTSLFVGELPAGATP